MTMHDEVLDALGEWRDECDEGKVDYGNDLIRRVKRAPLKQDNDDGDYTWNGDSIWLTYQGRSIQIRMWCGDVVVEVYRRYHEADEEAFDSAALALPRPGRKPRGVRK